MKGINRSSHAPKLSASLKAFPKFPEGIGRQTRNVALLLTAVAGLAACASPRDVAVNGFSNTNYDGEKFVNPNFETDDAKIAELTSGEKELFDLALTKLPTIAEDPQNGYQFMKIGGKNFLINNDQNILLVSDAGAKAFLAGEALKKEHIGAVFAETPFAVVWELSGKLTIGSNLSGMGLLTQAGMIVAGEVVDKIADATGAKDMMPEFNIYKILNELFASKEDPVKLMANITPENEVQVKALFADADNNPFYQAILAAQGDEATVEKILLAAEAAQKNDEKLLNERIEILANANTVRVVEATPVVKIVSPEAQAAAEKETQIGKLVEFVKLQRIQKHFAAQGTGGQNWGALTMMTQDGAYSQGLGLAGAVTERTRSGVLHANPSAADAAFREVENHNGKTDRSVTGGISYNQKYADGNWQYTTQLAGVRQEGMKTYETDLTRTKNPTVYGTQLVTGGSYSFNTGTSLGVFGGGFYSTSANKSDLSGVLGLEATQDLSFLDNPVFNQTSLSAVGSQRLNKWSDTFSVNAKFLGVLPVSVDLATFDFGIRPFATFQQSPAELKADIQQAGKAGEAAVKAKSGFELGEKERAELLAYSPEVGAFCANEKQKEACASVEADTAKTAMQKVGTLIARVGSEIKQVMLYLPASFDMGAGIANIANGMKEMHEKQEVVVAKILNTLGGGQANGAPLNVDISAAIKGFPGTLTVTSNNIVGVYIDSAGRLRSTGNVPLGANTVTITGQNGSYTFNFNGI